MVSPSPEQGRTVNTPGGHTEQLILPFPGQTTPVGHGNVQLVDPGKDQVFGGQNRCDDVVGHWYPGSHTVQLYVAPDKAYVPSVGQATAYPTPGQ